MILGVITIFGLTVIELLTTITLLGGIGGGILWIRAKLVELETKLKELEIRMNKNEQDFTKLEDKLDTKIDNLLDKIENVLELISTIKINCAYQKYDKK